MCVGVPVRKRHLHTERGHHLSPAEFSSATVSPSEAKKADVVVDPIPVAVVTTSVTPELLPPLREKSNKKNTVHFSSDPSSVAVVVDTVPSRSGMMAAGIASSVWYSPNELDDLRERARETARRLAIRKKATNGTSSSSSGDSSTSSLPTMGSPQTPGASEEDEDMSCPRGFELCLCPLRQRNRALARGSTLEFARRQQKKHYREGISTASPAIDPSVRLALVSSKLSRWAREVALSCGHSDFLDAYDVFRAVLPPPRTIEEISRDHAFPINTMRGTARTKTTTVVVTKRSLRSQEDREERRVKRRIR